MTQSPIIEKERKFQLFPKKTVILSTTLNKEEFENKFKILLEDKTLPLRLNGYYENGCFYFGHTVHRGSFSLNYSAQFIETNSGKEIHVGVKIDIVSKIMVICIIIIILFLSYMMHYVWVLFAVIPYYGCCSFYKKNSAFVTKYLCKQLSASIKREVKDK